MEKPNSNELDSTYRILSLIGYGCVASLFVYAGVIEFVKRGEYDFTGIVDGFEYYELLKAVLIGVSLMQFFAVGYVKSYILNKGLNKQSTVGVNPTEESHDIEDLKKRLMSAHMKGLAISESIAFYGFLLFSLSGNSFDYYIFMALSLVSIAINFPKKPTTYSSLGGD